jgi:hypothetical protein
MKPLRDCQRRILVIHVEIQDADDPQPTNTALEAISDYFARTWNANVTTSLFSDYIEGP